jgi:hypothetical protein
MGGSCGTHGRYEKCIRNFGSGTDYSEELGIVGEIILEWIFGK